MGWRCGFRSPAQRYTPYRQSCFLQEKVNYVDTIEMGAAGLLPILQSGGKITCLFDHAVRLGIPQVILHGQNLVHVLCLDKRMNGFHQVIGGAVAAVEAIHGGVIDPLLPGTANGNQMLLISLAEGFGDSGIQTITAFDVGVVLAVPLHFRLHQQVITDEILKAAILGGVLTEMLPEGAVEAALEAVHGCILSAGFLNLLHLLQICLLVIIQDPYQLCRTGFVICLRASVVPGVIKFTYPVQEAVRKGSGSHTLKDFFDVHS